LTLGLIDEPKFRLAGAEEAVAQLANAIDQVLKGHEPHYQVLARQAAEMHTRIHSLLFSLQKGSYWWGKRSKTASELAELLAVYPRLRLQFLLMHTTLAIYRNLQQGLQGQQREIAFCRGRLAEFFRQLGQAAAAEQQRLGEPAAGQYLLPPGCRTLADALQQIIAEIAPAEMLQLDETVQGEVHGWLKSLVHVCMSSSDLFSDLQNLICKQAEEFGNQRLGAADLVEIYRKQSGGVDQVLDDLAAAFDHALPELAPASAAAAEVRILAAPAGEAGERFRYLAGQALPQVQWLAATSTDELVLYREQPLQDLAELPQAGAAGRGAYDRLCRIDNFTPHSRCDIFDWRPLDNVD
jgi:hypothetical protein